MRLLVLLFVLFATPTFAADWTPWRDSCEAAVTGGAELLLAQAQRQSQGQGQGQGGQGQGQGGSNAQPEQRHPGDYCCVHCRHDEIPCGRQCLSKKSKEVCTEKRTCACPGKP